MCKDLFSQACPLRAELLDFLVGVDGVKGNDQRDDTADRYVQEGAVDLCAQFPIQPVFVHGQKSLPHVVVLSCKISPSQL